MKNTRGLVMASVLLFAACTDDGSDESDKGEVDRSALEDGLSVTLDKSMGTLILPFSLPVPDGDQADMENEFASAVSLVVKNNVSGATVSLMSGTMAADMPEGPGEFSVALNDDRDAMMVIFYNETLAGQSLHDSGDYLATLSIATNDYIENLGSTAVDITID